MTEMVGLTAVDSTRRTQRPWSMRARLYAVAMAAVLIAWLSGSWAIFEAANAAYDRMCEDHLVNLGKTILYFAEHELNEIRADSQPGEVVRNVHIESASTLRSRYAYQIWSREGELLLRSPNAPADERLGGSHGGGIWHIQRADGRVHEVYVLPAADGHMAIHVADLDDEQFLFTSDLSLRFVLMLALSLLPVLLGSWLLLRRALNPLSLAEVQLRQRCPRDLTPLQVPNPPREFEPLIDATNRLMAQLAQALNQERSFTAMAAHEMRIPLASLRVQAQVVSRAPEGERAQALLGLQHNVDRCARLLTQLLTLARMDTQEVDTIEKQPLDLADELAEVMVDFADEAERRLLRVTTEIQARIVHADRVALGALLRNLLANAMAHAPEGGRVRIQSVEQEGQVVLRVEDSGKGIPANERSRAFERFYRREGAAGNGVGLGLAIVAAVVRAHRAVVGLGESTLGGLKVEVSFPAAAELKPT